MNKIKKKKNQYTETSQEHSTEDVQTGKFALSLSISLSKVRHTKIYIYLMHDDKHQNLAPNTREYTHEVAKSNGQGCKPRRKSILKDSLVFQMYVCQKNITSEEQGHFLQLF